MNDLNYTLYIDESGVSSNKLRYNYELEKRSFFALGSLKAQKKDIDEFYNLYLKQYERNEEIKYKDLKKEIDVLHEILDIIEESDFEINIEFVESQLYYLTFFCDYVYYPIWLFDDEDVVELRKSFFHAFSNMFDESFFNLLDDLFVSENYEQYEKAFNDLIPFLIKKQIMSEDDLLRNLKLTKQLIVKGTFNIDDIKPLGNQYNKNTKIIILPHLQCLYNLIVKAKDINTIIHDENMHYQKLFQEDIKNNLNKNIVFKNSKSESGLKVVDIVVSYCKNTIEYMIKHNDYTEIDYVNKFINNINFIINKNSQDQLFLNSDLAPLAFLKYLKCK